MSYWEAVPFSRGYVPMVHRDKECRQLRRANVIRRVESTDGRTFCGACTPTLDPAQLAEMRRIAYADLRVAVREVMGEEAAAVVLAKLEG